LVIIIVLFSFCQPKVTNNIEALDRIFNMIEFKIEIQNWGCFGGSKELFEISKAGNEYLLKSKTTKKAA